MLDTFWINLKIKLTQIETKFINIYVYGFDNTFLF